MKSASSFNSNILSVHLSNLKFLYNMYMNWGWIKWLIKLHKKANSGNKSTNNYKWSANIFIYTHYWPIISIFSTNNQKNEYLTNVNYTTLVITS